MKRKILVVLCLLLAVGFVAARWSTNGVKTSAQGGDMIDPSATTLAIDLSIAEMTEQADLITIGNCVATKSVWVDRNLVTLATINVAESLKGNATSQVTVVLPGGADVNRKFPIAMTYPGAPRITPGENVFLFLNHDDEVGGGYTITGFAQGKFSIVKDEEGREVLSRDLTKVELQGRSATRRGTNTLTPLETLKSQIRRQLEK